MARNFRSTARWGVLCVFGLLTLGGGGAAHADPHHTILLEAEQFAEYGGWVDDSQFMDQMGSPFLLAHGLGEPVRDATTAVTVPATGAYRGWVRTRDWVATWKAPGAPGRFELLINDVPLKTTFGTQGAAWHWQDGGTVQLRKGNATVALHDLTGFDGRCDAIVLTTDPDFRPPNADPAMAAFRRAALGLTDQPLDGGAYDLVVIGGGMSGTCASLSASRLGLKVALIQDRPVLGGNNSSEIRVWLHGARNREPWPRVGDIVAELEHKVREHYGPKNTAEIYEDDKRLALVRSQENLTLLLRHRANAVEMKDGRIQAVIAQHTLTGQRYRIKARWFADCTGDGCIGALAGADYDMTEKGHMGRCNLWHVLDTGKAAPFPRCPWALDLSDKPFPGRGEKTAERMVLKLGGWYWESGFDHNPFEKSEYIRDWNFRAAYGAWDALKNVDRVLPTYKLGWMAHIAGKRESRRLLGDVVLTRQHLLSGHQFPDACVPLGWTMDLHLPDPRYEKGFEGDGFISKATFGRYKMPFFLPYRCLYSRNVPNLFMAGRDISVTHDALGAVRVMRTGGCMGEIVGMAAAVCKKNDADPRDVYEQYLDELKDRMRKGVGRAPATTTNPDHSSPAVPVDGAASKPVTDRRAPQWLAGAGVNLARTAKVTVSGNYDASKYPPVHLIDGKAGFASNDDRWLSDARVPAWIELRWPRAQTISAARIQSGHIQNGRPAEPIRAFTLQYEHDGQWRDIPSAGATDNTAADWTARFEPVTTRGVRLWITATHTDVARIWEVELYHPGTKP